MSDKEVFELIKMSLAALGSMITIIGVVIGAFVKTLHSKGMGELQEIKKAIIENQISTALHNEKISQMDKEFIRIDEHQKSQDDQLHNIRNNIHNIRNKLVSVDHIQLLIENSIKKESR
jgi:hypothetical protein